jgi:hypothetical protein
MTYEHAKIILDRVRDGIAYPNHTIQKALEMTGDIDGHIKGMDEGMRSEGVDQALPHQSFGGGEVGSLGMVAKDLIQHSQKAWTSRR